VHSQVLCTSPAPLSPQDKKAAARAAEDTSDTPGSGGGASARELETAAILEQLSPQGLVIKAVAADGNCLFRAVSDQLLLLSSRAGGGGSVPDHAVLRRRAAEYIRAHGPEFAPFLPYEPADGYPEGEAPDEAAVRAAVARYCLRLAGSVCWGGHPELRALSCTLGLPFLVFQAGAPPYSITPDAEVMAEQGTAPAAQAAGSSSAAAGSAPSGSRRRRDARQRAESEGGGLDESPGRWGAGALMADANLRIQLSFHKLIAQGEHYNSVVPRGGA